LLSQVWYKIFNFLLANFLIINFFNNLLTKFITNLGEGKTNANYSQNVMPNFSLLKKSKNKQSLNNSIHLNSSEIIDDIKALGNSKSKIIIYFHLLRFSFSRF
jgi:hypothetical protein